MLNSRRSASRFGKDRERVQHKLDIIKLRIFTYIQNVWDAVDDYKLVLFYNLGRGIIMDKYRQKIATLTDSEISESMKLNESDFRPNVN